MKRMLVLAMFMAGVLLASNPMIGTWKMNVEKSKFIPAPGPQSVTATYTEDGDWVAEKVEGVGSDGKPINLENRVKDDGNEYPYQSRWGKGTLVIKKENPNHWTSILKLDDNHTITSKSVISEDGKTRTQTSTGTDSKGEKVKSTTVWERQ